jgi:type II secretion system protein J
MSQNTYGHPVKEQDAARFAFKTPKWGRPLRLPSASSSPHPKRHQAFTLLEALVAVAIFALLLAGVTTLWLVSWRNTERVMKGGHSQSPIDRSLRRIGASMKASVFRKESKKFYAWRTGEGEGRSSHGDGLSFVTALAPDAGEGSSELAPLERILIKLEDNHLVMKAAPFTMIENEWQRTTALSENISAFEVRFLSSEEKEWKNEWKDEDHAPAAVRIGIALQGEDLSSDPEKWTHQWVESIPEPPSEEAVAHAQEDLPPDP